MVRMGMVGGVDMRIKLRLELQNVSLHGARSRPYSQPACLRCLNWQYSIKPY